VGVWGGIGKMEGLGRGIYTAGQVWRSSCVGIREGKMSSASSVALGGLRREVLYGAL